MVDSYDQAVEAATIDICDYRLPDVEWARQSISERKHALDIVRSGFEVSGLLERLRVAEQAIAALRTMKDVGDRLRNLDMNWPNADDPVEVRNAVFKSRVGVWGEWTDARLAAHDVLAAWDVVGTPGGET